MNVPQPPPVIYARRRTRTPGPFDTWQRQVAADIERDRTPGWVVWWGAWSRRFWAVPTWQNAPVLIVESRSVGELHAAMTAVESGTPPLGWGMR